MNEASLWITLIVGVTVGVLPAIATFILTLRNGWRMAEMKVQADEARADIADNTAKTVAVAENVQKIETHTNSLTSQLVASTAKASIAEGHAAGLADAAVKGEKDDLSARLSRVEDLLQRLISPVEPK